MRVIEHEILIEGQALIDRALALEDAFPGVKRAYPIWKTTVRIDEHHQLAIDLVNGDTPWVNVALLRDGVEIDDIGPANDVFGDYDIPSLDVRVVVTREPAYAPASP